MLNINIKTISEIESRYYFTPIKERLEEKAKVIGDIKAMNYLTEIMQNATAKVEILIQDRINLQLP
ncbi:MAG: hypothetical protein HYR78_05435 [Nitrospirae bacterium]|nr:hypothetical protein [Nitrospirota bacterium]